VRIEILKQAMPELRKAYLLTSAGNLAYRRDSPRARGVMADVRSLGVELGVVEAEADHRHCACRHGRGDRIRVAGER
jgi:hypothetical protein